VTPLREGYALPRHREVVSPELALVDPELAASARASLPEPRAAPRRSGPSARVQVGDASAQALTALSNAALATNDERGSPAPAERSWRVLISVAAVSILSLLLFDVRVQVGKTPASAEAPQNPPAAAATLSRAPVPSVPRRRVQKGSVSRAPVPSVPRRRVQKGVKDTAKPGARRFAWAPAPGASAYHIEFFRGSELAFSANTTGPELTVPAVWKDVRGTHSLVPGEYRWYVWPVHSGTRASTAIVRAKLLVS
jgi:hypothetical protein